MSPRILVELDERELRAVIALVDAVVSKPPDTDGQRARQRAIWRSVQALGGEVFTQRLIERLETR